MFTREEAALAYALSGERLLGADASFLHNNPPVVPIFVTLLFQSLEICIKHVGIASGLVTESDVRTREVRSGHGIQELAALVVERLQGKPFDPLIQALTFFHCEPGHADIIRKMIQGQEFERTRTSYATRRLGYAEVCAGDFALVDGLAPWVSAIKQMAVKLPDIVSLVSQWRSSVDRSGPFAIWLAGDSRDSC